MTLIGCLDTEPISIRQCFSGLFSVLAWPVIYRFQASFLQIGILVTAPIHPQPDSGDIYMYLGDITTMAKDFFFIFFFIK